MKKIFLLFVCIGFTSPLLSQKGYFDYTVVVDSPSYSFPILKMDFDNNTVLKINTLLQLSELNMLSMTNDKNIFRLVYSFDDSIPFGETWINYNILSNTPSIFSVAIAVEWCGASCGHWTNYYNFNSGNGDIISVYDLLDTKTVTEATSYIQLKRTLHFLTQFNNLDETETVDTTSILSEIENSNLPYFYIAHDSIFIDDEECLTKADKLGDLDMITAFSFTELKKYLSDYGATLLSNSKMNISSFHGTDFPQLYKGTLDDSIPFYFSYRFYYDNNGSGFFAFTKDGIAHGLEGTFEGNHFDLTEPDENYNDKGFIKADFVDGKIIGT